MNSTDTSAFLRENRGSEGHFEIIYARLIEEIAASPTPNNYVAALQEIKEKSAEEYKRAKETGGTTWPEFEKFVADFEKAVLQHSR